MWQGVPKKLRPQVVARFHLKLNVQYWPSCGDLLNSPSSEQNDWPKTGHELESCGCTYPTWRIFSLQLAHTWKKKPLTSTIKKRNQKCVFQSPKNFSKNNARFLFKYVYYTGLWYVIFLPLSQNVQKSGVVNQPPSHQPGVQLIKGIPTKGITTAVAQFLERTVGSSRSEFHDEPGGKFLLVGTTRKNLNDMLKACSFWPKTQWFDQKRCQHFQDEHDMFFL